MLKMLKYSKSCKNIKIIKIIHHLILKNSDFHCNCTNCGILGTF